MKYKDKFQDMVPIHDERECIILGTQDIPCYICKELTRFVEINYESSFCSEECMDRFEDTIYQEYE